MMLQADDSQLLNISSNAPSVLEITNDKCIDEFKTSDKQAVLNGVAKKVILKKVLDHKKPILKIAAYADEAYGFRDDQSVERQSKQMFEVRNVLHSNNSINQADNAMLAQTVVLLFDKFQFLLGYNQKMEEEAGGVAARAACADPSHIKLMKEFITKREAVDARLVSKAANAGNDPVLNGLPLTAQQKSRKFGKALIPSDPKYWKCPFCGHPSVNEDPDNQKYEENNRKKDEIHQEKMKVWKDYKEKHDKWTTSESTGPEPEPPQDPFDKDKQMSKRKPRAGKHEVAALQCMCFAASCTQLGSDIGSNCYLLCRVIDQDKCCEQGIHPARAVRTTQERHPTITQGSRECCGCPTCLCPCSMRYPVDSLQKIASAKAKAELQQRNGQQQRSTGIEETANFFRAVSGAGAISAGTVLQSNRDLVQGSNNQGQVSDQVLRDHYHQGVAMAAARIGSSALTHEGIGAMRDGFGRNTTVELPSGDEYDTRLIGTKRNAHQQNNRLPGLPEDELLDATSSGGATQPHPGMLDSLNPDYSDMSDRFIQANQSTNLASQLVSGPIGSIGSQTAARSAAAHQSVANQRPPMYNPNNYVPNSMSEQDQIQATMAGMSKDTKQSMMNAAAASGRFASKSATGTEEALWMNTIEDSYLDEDGAINLYDSPLDQRKMPASKMPPPNPPQRYMPPSNQPQHNIPSHRPRDRNGGNGRQEWNPFTGLVGEGGKKKKPPGGVRVIDRINQKNAKRMSIKKKKPNKEGKKERRRAKRLHDKISEINAKDKTEETGNTLAMACGVRLSQVSAFVDGAVADEDGDYFQSQEGLGQLTTFLSLDTESEGDDSK